MGQTPRGIDPDEVLSREGVVIRQIVKDLCQRPGERPGVVRPHTLTPASDVVCGIPLPSRIAMGGQLPSDGGCCARWAPTLIPREAKEGGPSAVVEREVAEIAAEKNAHGRDVRRGWNGPFGPRLSCGYRRSVCGGIRDPLGDGGWRAGSTPGRPTAEPVPPTLRPSRLRLEWP